MRALRWAFTSRPSAGITNTPFFFVSLTAVSVRFSRKATTDLLLVSSFSARWRTSWVLVMPEAMNPPLITNLIFLRGGYLILELLWKNSVSAIFYAVFFILSSKKPMKTGFPAARAFQTVALPGIYPSEEQSTHVGSSFRTKD